jgi:hypothetical protein
MAAVKPPLIKMPAGVLVTAAPSIRHGPVEADMRV